MHTIRRTCFPFIILIMLFAIPAFSQDDKGALKPSNLSVSFNGKFVYRPVRADSKTNSENGVFWCTYGVGRVDDEVRELVNFALFENDQLRYTLEVAPGSDLSISNKGIVAFMDMTYHYRGELTIHFYSKRGHPLFSETFKGASLFGFSPQGNTFGVGTATHLVVISVENHQVEMYEKGFQFSISEDENLVAVAREGIVAVYENGNVYREFETGFIYARGVWVSSDFDILAVIDKRHLNVYSLSGGCLLFDDTLRGKRSYRDLMIHDGLIVTGIHHRGDGLSRGILKAYDCHGTVLLDREESVKHFKTFEKREPTRKSSSEYEQIPWPFFPFDAMHTVWNYYEQHMGGAGPDWSYLHQGLDIITPIAEPTYAVAPGFVKCVLTLGGEIYWRTAISKEQTAGYSNGWLYAHLIESTIQFDVGDSVEVHDYLGDIIEWTEEWGHIHFVEIRDTGTVWEYYDNEWGINYNPLLSLHPDTDLIPPIIENVFAGSKFGLCTNETSNYLDPDSVYGYVDIIVKVRDFVGDSDWEQPAYAIYYWVKKLPEGEVVFPRTLGQILNHSYNFYATEHYEQYATLLYKRDYLLMPSSWMDKHRNYYHILTNNNGDSLAELSEKFLAFSTDSFPDGDYRIVVEALDEYGNSTIDSMDVRFQNGVGIDPEASENAPFDFNLAQNYPNPFNPTTEIGYSLPSDCHVTLEVYNLRGQRVARLVDGRQKSGYKVANWNASSVASGVYVCRLRAGDWVETKKMIVLK